MIASVTRRFAALGILAGSAFCVAQAVAVGTRTFDLHSGDDFKGGDLDGVAVDASGHVRAGFDLSNVPVTDASSIWSALPLADGSVLLGTGNEGKLIQVTAGTAKVVAETKSLVVTSLTAAWGGAVVLGTLPNGEVMKWDHGKLTSLAKLKGAEHVWQVAYDAKTKGVFAATGPEGKLYRIDAQGNAQVYFDAEEQHLMSVAVGPDGSVYTGTSDKAKLYKLTGPGRATVLHDFARTEVRGIAVADNGTVYAIANEIKEGSYTPASHGESSSAGPAPKATPVKGKGTLYAFSPDGKPEQLIDDKDEHFVSVAVGDDGKPYVGTGVEGRIYTVDDQHNSVLIADTPERQIFAMWLRGKQRFVASSDPAVLHPITGIGGPDAVWTSKVLDAGLRAQFGRLTWLSTAPVELSTRSGNTAEPDDTWSAWSAPLVQPGPITSPAARYLQLRARFSRDPRAVLSEITVPFVTDNLRAVVTDIGADEESKTATGIESSGGPITKKADPTISLKWKVDNPDKDELVYRLQYRLIGTTDWYDILDPKEKLTKTSYSWDTADLPEGRYRVRVVASDEISNPPELAKKHELESTVILVDNTPPSIEGLEVVGRKIRGTAIDGVGPISRIEISIPGTNDWYPFFPRDGVFDEQREEFDADVSSFAPQGHAMLSVRVYDHANNFVVRHVTLK